MTEYRRHCWIESSHEEFSGISDREGYRREIVLIMKDVVVRWPARTQQTAVRLNEANTGNRQQRTWKGEEKSQYAYLKVEIELDRVGDRLVHYKPSRAVPTLVAISRVLREEPDMVALADDDNCDLGVDLELRASS